MRITEQLVDDLRTAYAAQRVKDEANRTFIPHCLIVEDDRHDAELSRLAIESVDNVTADIAYTGDQAIEMLREAKAQKRESYHIVFLDLTLTGSAAQGYDVLRYIRREMPSIHVVVVSGYIDQGVINFLASDRSSSGYLGVVTKPLHEANLRDVLRKHRMNPDSPDWEV